MQMQAQCITKPHSKIALLIALLCTIIPWNTMASEITESSTTHNGLVAGLLHPVLGFDHLLAMIAVGLLSVQLGRRHLFMLPATFVLFLAVGGGAGLMGIEFIQVEGIIALSVLVLGLAIASQAKVALALAYPIVAIFATFHGHAHGAEVPTASDPMLYVAGFLTASAILHILGVTIGFVVRTSSTRALIGAGCAGVGLHMVLLTYGLV